MKEDENNWLDGTKFWASFSPAWFKMFQRKFQLLKGDRKSFDLISTDLKKSDRYIESIDERLQFVRNYLQQLKSTVKYGELQGLDKLLKKNEVDKSDYLKFIYESHLIKLVSMIDLLAKLGFSVFDITLDSYKMSGTYFLRTAETKNTPSAQILRNFIETISNDKGNRNLIIHDGNYSNQLVEEIWSTEIDNKYIKSELVREFFNKKRKVSTANLASEMNSNFEEALECTKKFIDSLTSELESRLKNKDFPIE